jgi:hypothetical protein
VPGHRTGKERIILWIALGGSGKTKEQRRSPQQRNTEPVKYIYASRAVQCTSTSVIGTPLTVFSSIFESPSTKRNEDLYGVLR